MYRTFLIVAVTVTLASLMGDRRAEATALAAPHALSPAVADAALVQRVVNVCGLNGCARVQTSRVQHYRYHHP